MATASTIKMPLDANIIARGVMPVAIDDPIKTMEGVARVRQLQQQAQLFPLQQQNLQSEAALRGTQTLEYQQRIKEQQDAQREDDIIKQEFLKNSDDFSKLRTAVAPQVGMARLQKLDADHELAIKTETEKNKAQRDADLANRTEIGNEITGILETPPEARQAAYEGAKTRLIQKKLVDSTRLPDQVPDEQTLTGLAASVGYGKQVADIANRRAQEQERIARAKKEDEQTVANTQATRLKNTADMRQQFNKELVAQGKDITAENYRTIRAKYPEIAGDYPAELENPATGRKAEHTLKAIENSTMNAQQRALANSRGKSPTPMTVALEQARGELGDDADAAAVDARANEIYADTRKAGTRAPGSGTPKPPFTPTHIAANIEKHNGYADQEQAQWRAAQQALDDINEIPQESRDAKNNPAYAKLLKRYNDSREKAVDLQDKQKEIRRTHGWGGFAPDATDEQKAAEAKLGRNGTAPASSAQAPATTPDPASKPTPAPVVPKPAAIAGGPGSPKSVTKNGKTYTEGQQVRVGGKTVTIKKLYDDGTFDY